MFLTPLKDIMVQGALISVSDVMFQDNPAKGKHLSEHHEDSFQVEWRGVPSGLAVAWYLHHILSHDICF